MKKLVQQPDLKKGYNKIITSADNLKFICEFGILVLEEGLTNYKDSSGETEMALVILEGPCSIKVGGKNWANIGERKNVFEGLPATVYIPPGYDFEVNAEKAKIAFCKALASNKEEPFYVSPGEVSVKNVGKNNWSREVRIMIGQDSKSQKFIIGETINPSGNWSGTPPHKHDVQNADKESCHEELYYFLSDKPQGWGIERIYTKDGEIDELLLLKDNTVTIMPKGYHPVVVAPGYNFYYLWFLAGENNKVTPFEDPSHNWIKG